MEMFKSGYFFLFCYVISVGVASFLQKILLKQISPYQINLIMAIGSISIAIIALKLHHDSLSMPAKAIIIGIPIGLMMPLGAIAYIIALSKLEVSTAAAISISYVVIASILSAVFLKEEFSWIKLLGILLTIAGVAILTTQSEK